jgi:membrane protease YdiL (CAAX protease family)
MDISFLKVYTWSYVFGLVCVWLFFFIYSFRNNINRPWGFGIVLAGFLVSGYGFAFYVSQFGFFHINYRFLVCLIGVFLNINNIREQFYIQYRRVYDFLGGGLVLGLFLGFSQSTLLGFENFKLDSRFIPFAIMVSIVQVSIAEELLYRGYLLSFLAKYGFGSIHAIVFQSLVFTGAHLPGYWGNWIALCNVFLLGFVASYITWKTNNLLPAIVMHLAGNLIGFVWWLTLA